MSDAAEVEAAYRFDAARREMLDAYRALLRASHLAGVHAERDGHAEMPATISAMRQVAALEEFAHA
jgi:hypothetical protein